MIELNLLAAMEGIDPCISDGDDCSYSNASVLIENHNRGSSLISACKLYFLCILYSELFVNSYHL
jgi:hypothetical protein